MNVEQKIAWKEGLFLQPQHFQQMERGIYGRLNLLYSAGLAGTYGFSKLNIEYDSAISTIKVTSLEGVTPDGTPFSLSRQSELPAPRICSEHFTGDKKSLMLYLALPKIEYGSKNISSKDEKNLSTRYISVTEEVIDEYFGIEKESVEFGRLNFQILFDDEKRDGFELLPLARIIFKGDIETVIDTEFIPPLLNIQASDVLYRYLNQFLDSIISKAKALSANRVIDNEGYAGYDSGREGSIMLLHTLNGSIPLIASMLKSKSCKPVDIFNEILSLLGRLCTFSSELSITDLPVYDHDKIFSNFEELTTNIRKVLTAGVRESCVTIAVNEAGPAKYSAKIENSKLFITSDFYIGIYADIPENQLVVSTLPVIKMSSREDLENIIISALPGIPIYHSFSVPTEIPKKPGFAYFRIETDDEKWESVKRTSSVGIYLPGELKDLNIELFALRKEGRRDD